MSDEFTDNIDDYLQFTPLASLAPVSQFIECFDRPKVVPPIDYETEGSNTKQIGLPDLERALDHVLKHAIHLRPYDHVQPSCNIQHVAKDETDALDPYLETLINNFKRAVFAPDDRLSGAFQATLRPAVPQADIPQDTTQQKSGSELSDSSRITNHTPDVKPTVFQAQILHHTAAQNSVYKIQNASTGITEIALPPNTDSPRQSQDTKDVTEVSPSRKRGFTPLEMLVQKKPRQSVPRSPTKTPPICNDTMSGGWQLEQSASLVALTSFLDDLFEADDRMVEDTSTTQTSYNRSLFFDNASDERILSGVTLQRLSSILHRAEHFKVVAQVDNAALLRLQRILLRSVNTFDSVQLQTLEGSQETGDENEWLKLIHAAQNALTSSLSMLIILMSDVDSKELVAEEYLLSVVDCLRSSLDDLYLRWTADLMQGKALPVVMKHKMLIDGILQYLHVLMRRLTDVLTHVPITESIVTRLVFLAASLIYMDTPEKTVLITSSLVMENLKTAAVAILQSIFAHLPNHRQFVLDEVLSSINKLSANRQIARQFRLGTGKSIQLTSSLLMNLIQSCAIPRKSALDYAESSIALKSEEPQRTGKSEKEPQILDIPEELPACLVASLERFNSATHTARYVVHFFLEKYMKSLRSTESDEAPFKGLLDVFIEDFLTVLTMPEWPAAELLLRLIAQSMLSLLDNPKQIMLVKSSAVDVLCSIACKIRTTLAEIRHLKSDSGQINRSALFDAMQFELILKDIPRDLEKLATLHSTLSRYLLESSNSKYDHGALSEYASVVWSQLLIDASRDARNATPEFKKLLIRTAAAATSKDDTAGETKPAELVSDSIAAQVNLHLLSFSGLLHMFDTILSRLLVVMDSPQITLRTKGLRSFGRLSEADPSILSMRAVQKQIAARVSDLSPQVRDVAIDLLGKYMTANPLLGSQYYSILKERLLDTGLNVRKRVMKLCKDLYCSSDNHALKVDIAGQFLRRIHDEEESIQDLVYKSLEMMWFESSIGDESSSTLPLAGTSSKTKLDIASRTVIISALAAEQSDVITNALVEIFSKCEEKIGGKSYIPKILCLFSEVMLEGLISNIDEGSRLANFLAMRALALSVPTTFTDSQMNSLLPYLQQGQTDLERETPALVASIYTSVLPTMKSKDLQFLLEIQNNLLGQLTKMSIKTLKQAIPCLCIVSRLRDDYVRPARTLKSCVVRLRSLVPQSLSNVPIAQEKQIILLLHLVGLFGRYLDIPDKKVLLEFFEVSSRPALVKTLMESIFIYHQSEMEAAMGSIAKAALQNIGNIGISSPELFLKSAILKYTDSIMNGSQLDSKRLLLNILDEFLLIEQQKNDKVSTKSNNVSQLGRPNSKKGKPSDTVEADGSNLADNTERSAADGISPSLMQRYLKQILNAALGLDLSLAITATHLIHRIVDQGLANPRNCIPTIIALETSSDLRLREPAASMHRDLSEKHASLIDSCYIDGVKRAFRYQMLIHNNNPPLGDRSTIGTLYSIIRHTRKGRQKFLTSLTRGLEPDLEKLDQVMETDVKYALFICHNLAVLEMTTNEEVHVLIHAMDKILSTTGGSCSALIESKNDGTFIPEQVGKVAAILCYISLLRSQLKSLYGLSEIKCQAFQPSRAGVKADTKPSVKSVEAPPSPDWSRVNGAISANERFALFLELLNRHDFHILDHDRDSDTEVQGPDLSVPTKDESIFENPYNTLEL